MWHTRRAEFAAAVDAAIGTTACVCIMMYIFIFKAQLDSEYTPRQISHGFLRASKSSSRPCFSKRERYRFGIGSKFAHDTLVT